MVEICNIDIFFCMILNPRIMFLKNKLLNSTIGAAETCHTRPDGACPAEGSEPAAFRSGNRPPSVWTSSGSLNDRVSIPTDSNAKN